MQLIKLLLQAHINLLIDKQALLILINIGSKIPKNASTTVLKKKKVRMSYSFSTEASINESEGGLDSRQRGQVVESVVAWHHTCEIVDQQNKVLKQKLANMQGLKEEKVKLEKVHSELTQENQDLAIQCQEYKVQVSSSLNQVEHLQEEKKSLEHQMEILEQDCLQRTKEARELGEFSVLRKLQVEKKEELVRTQRHYELLLLNKDSQIQYAKKSRKTEVHQEFNAYKEEKEKHVNQLCDRLRKADQDKNRLMRQFQATKIEEVSKLHQELQKYRIQVEKREHALNQQLDTVKGMRTQIAELQSQLMLTVQEKDRNLSKFNQRLKVLEQQRLEELRNFDIQLAEASSRARKEQLEYMKTRDEQEEQLKKQLRSLKEEMNSEIEALKTSHMLQLQSRQSQLNDRDLQTKNSKPSFGRLKQKVHGSESRFQRSSKMAEYQEKRNHQLQEKCLKLEEQLGQCRMDLLKHQQTYSRDMRACQTTQRDLKESLREAKEAIEKKDESIRELCLNIRQRIENEYYQLEAQSGGHGKDNDLITYLNKIISYSVQT